MTWDPTSVHIMQNDGDQVGARRVHGYAERGLGLWPIVGWAPDRTETLWGLFHLGSGVCVLLLRGDVRTVFPFAGEVAAAIDWTLFDRPNGWEQTDPDLPEKMRALTAAAPEGLVVPFAKGIRAAEDDDARRVIEAREGEVA